MLRRKRPTWVLNFSSKGISATQMYHQYHNTHGSLVVACGVGTQRKRIIENCIGFTLQGSKSYLEAFAIDTPALKPTLAPRPEINAHHLEKYASVRSCYARHHTLTG